MSATGSRLLDLVCPKCGSSRGADAVAQLCACGSPLLARYDLEAVRRSVSREAYASRDPGLWRLRELMPLRDDRFVVSLGESQTPIVPLPSAGAAAGLRRLSVKDESLLPTGSFKARGAAVGVSRAKELGVSAFAMPTNGNAGAAWAAYGARAGMAATIVMPRAAPPIHRFECAAAGARIVEVDGFISDAGKRVAQLVAESGIYDASTLKEPYRIEGKKTMGFEIAAQSGWTPPDVIVYPTGGGVGLIGIHKALRELQALGWTGDAMPRFVAAQASGCAPIVRAFDEGAESSTSWDRTQTVAFGIAVPKALGDFLVLRAVRETGGCAIAVDDDEIVRARDRVARDDGVLLCLEGAATFAAAARLRESGWIRDGERVLLINTGSALKMGAVAL